MSRKLVFASILASAPIIVYARGPDMVDTVAGMCIGAGLALSCHWFWSGDQGGADE